MVEEETNEVVFNNEKESENDRVAIGETRRLQIYSSIFPRMYGCVYPINCISYPQQG